MTVKMCKAVLSDTQIRHLHNNFKSNFIHALKMCIN